MIKSQGTGREHLIGWWKIEGTPIIVLRQREAEYVTWNFPQESCAFQCLLCNRHFWVSVI